MIYILFNFQRQYRAGKVQSKTMVKIYVGKLGDNVTDSDLRNLFEQFGTVEDAERVGGRDIGFVHMPNEQMALTAVRY